MVVAPPTQANLREAQEANFRLRDGPLTVSSDYKYLGVESGKTGAGCWNAFLHRVHKGAMRRVHQLCWAIASGKHPVRLDTAVHLFEAYVRPSFEYANGLWGAMLSSAGLNSLEVVQAEFAKSVLRMRGTKPAFAFLRAELGLWPVSLRVKQATLLLFGTLAGLPASRLAGHVFRRRCREVDLSGPDGTLAKYSWCKVAKQVLTAANERGCWVRRTVPSNWEQRVKASCEAELRAKLMSDLAQFSSLDTVVRFKPVAGLEQWLAPGVQHPGALLKVKLRAGCLPLMKRIGTRNHIPDPLRACLFCNTGEVESEQHFAASCPFYNEERGRLCAKLVSIAGGPEQAPSWLLQPTVEDLSHVILGAKCWQLPVDCRARAERCVHDFLRKAWKKREGLWSRVCRNGDPWLL